MDGSYTKSPDETDQRPERSGQSETTRTRKRNRDHEHEEAVPAERRRLPKRQIEDQCHDDEIPGLGLRSDISSSVSQVDSTQSKASNLTTVTRTKTDQTPDCDGTGTADEDETLPVLRSRFAELQTVVEKREKRLKNAQNKLETMRAELEAAEAKVDKRDQELWEARGELAVVGLRVSKAQVAERARERREKGVEKEQDA